MSNGRFLVLALVLVLGIAASLAVGGLGSPFASAGYRELEIPFSEFPESLDRWTLVREEPLSPREEEILGQDRYLRRIYANEGGASVRLFVCYYGNKERGLEAIYHNPTICLPAAGWEWSDSERRRITLRDAAREFEVSVDRFRNAGREISILNFFVLDGRILEQTPRNTPFRLGLAKLTPSSDPGYFAQVQVVPVAPAEGADARDAAVDFLEAAGDHILRHFWWAQERGAE